MCKDRDILAMTEANMAPHFHDNNANSSLKGSQSKMEPLEDHLHGKFAKTQAFQKVKGVDFSRIANKENTMLPTRTECKPILTTSSSSDDLGQQHEAAPELKSCLASNTGMHNGARPKTKMAAKQPKAVKFAREVSMEVYTTDSQYEDMKCCLLDIHIPPHVLGSTSVTAVKYMLKDTQEELLGLLDITIKMLRVKHDRWPTCTEIYATMIEPNFDEKFVITSFIEICHTEQGNVVVKNLLAEQQQKIEEHESSQSEKNLETISDWSLQSADITDTDQNDSMSNATAADHTVLSDQDIVNDELPAVSQHQHSTTSSSSACVDQNILPSTTQILKPMTKEQIMQQQIKLLKREHEYLTNGLNCYQCKERPIAVTLLPCGHFVLCAQCSDTCYVCPICNKKALAEVKTFLA